VSDPGFTTIEEDEELMSPDLYERAIAQLEAERHNGRAQWEQKPKPRFVPILLDDISADDSPTYLIDGLLPSGPSLGFTIGPPKSLKSFLLKDAFLHIAGGIPYCGRNVTPGAVVYITSEGVLGVKRRLVAMRRFHGLEGRGVAFFLIPAMPNLGTGTSDRDELIRMIEAVMEPLGVPLRAVGIDTLRRAVPGKSENDQKDMSVFLANGESIATRFGTHFNSVHHSPRSDEGRGSGTNAIDGAADVMWTVARQEPKSLIATACVSAMKDGSEDAEWAFQICPDEIGVDRNGDPIWACHVELTGEPKQAASKQHRARMGKWAKTAFRALKEAVDECGRTPPASNHIPHGVRVVTIEQWRQYAYSRGISTGGDRAQQKAFKTATDQLIGDALVGAWNEHVWLP
jgi:RecA-family ATPase